MTADDVRASPRVWVRSPRCSARPRGSARWRPTSTWRSSTPRTASRSAARSARSRRSSTCSPTPASALEMSKAIAVAAAATSLGSGDDPTAPSVASMAKAFVGDARHRSWPRTASRCSAASGTRGSTTSTLYLRRLAADAELLRVGRRGTATQLAVDGPWRVTPMTERPTRRRSTSSATRARAWLAANLERRDAGDAAAPTRGTAPTTTWSTSPAQRALQRKLFDAGYAGITWPKEYGGQGLDPARTSAPSARRRAGYVDARPRHRRRRDARGVRSDDGGARVARVPRAVTSREMLRGRRDRGASSSPSPTPAPTSPACARRPSATATAGSSTARRSGAAARYYADYGMCLARTDWDVPKHRGPHVVRSCRPTRPA